MAPLPKRESALARPRIRKGGEQKVITKGEMRPVTFAIEPDPQWHPIARQIWDSCQTSGQFDFYQDSDLALLFSICDDLSFYKHSAKRSPVAAQVIYSTLGDLLVSEADRRRVRIELHAPEGPVNLASVKAIGDYKKDLGL